MGLVPEAVAGAVDEEDVALVEEPVEDRGGDDVIAEELAPTFEGDVRRDQERRFRIAVSD